MCIHSKIEVNSKLKTVTPALVCEKDNATIDLLSPKLPVEYDYKGSMHCQSGATAMSNTHPQCPCKNLPALFPIGDMYRISDMH